VYNSRFASNKASDASTGGIVRGHGGALHLDGTFNSFNPLTSNKVEVCGCVFEDNSAVRGGGAIKVTISDGANTKAIYQRSAFTNNRLVGAPPAEGHGGAIYHIEDDYANGGNEDNFEISESTFAGNFAQRQGGGVWVYVKGRGRIVNTTFHDNRAAVAGTNIVGQGGGLVISLGVIDILNTTFANNFATFQGGAVFAGSGPETTVTLYNSLFYQNRLDPTHTNPATTEWQGYHTNRPLNNGGNNLQFPRTKTPDFNNDVNNLITSPASAILFSDPLLGPLANNSGFTLTRLPSAGSPALNAGNNATCPNADQRGISRPQGNACDIGSVEVVLQLSASPSLVAIDDGAFTLTVSGYDFTAGSQIVWRGTTLATTFVSSTTLRATVAANQIGGVGAATVTVSGSGLPAATVTVVQTLQRVYLPVVRR
jgi:predicted outer membrane repeat protein